MDQMGRLACPWGKVPVLFLVLVLPQKGGDVGVMGTPGWIFPHPALTYFLHQPGR